jgi:LPXTG-site transpeptidase (sortase) family protein
MNFNILVQAVLARKWRFAIVFFVVFTATYSVLYAIDFLPEEPSQGPAVLTEAVEVPALSDEDRASMSDESDWLQSVSEQALHIEILDADIEIDQDTNESPVLPTEIYIERLNKTIKVLNPVSRTVADLDNALLSGAVRHPDSATLTQEGNVFILGHSSYLPTVLNRNFKAFNGIENLEWGDTIVVTGGNQTYTYRVEKVFEAKASEVTIPIANTGSMLTLATCDSFGSTDDRFIVEASLQSVESF